MENYSEPFDTDNLTQVLRSVLEELNQPPFGLYVEIEDIDYELAKWTVNVSQFSAVITGQEMTDALLKNPDLPAAMKHLVFEKFQWLISEV